jgi:hypothetical protein
LHAGHRIWNRFVKESRNLRDINKAFGVLADFRKDGGHGECLDWDWDWYVPFLVLLV